MRARFRTACNSPTRILTHTFTLVTKKSYILLHQCQKSPFFPGSYTLRDKVKQLENVFKRDQNIKILYLVRDPRAMFSSRFRNTMFRNRLKARDKPTMDVCHRYRSNFEYLQDSDKSSWLKQRLYHIRYEDLAWNPHKYSEKINEFLGLRNNEKVHKWIDENTQSSIGQTYYNTKRDSKTNLQQWRIKKNLPWSWVEEIQNKCSDMMEIFGYLRVHM